MKNKIKKISGAIAVEFVIFFIGLLIIFGVALELSLIIRLEEYATLLARESASMSYRDCAEDQDQVELTKCLNEVRDNVAKIAGNLINGSEILISVYRYDGASSSKSMTQSICNHSSSESHQSLYSLNGNRITPLSNSFLSNQRVVVIAESFVPYKPYFPGIAGAFGFESKMLYEVSIL